MPWIYDQFCLRYSLHQIKSVRDSKSLQKTGTVANGNIETKHVSQQWSKNVANLTQEVKG